MGRRIYLYVSYGLLFLYANILFFAMDPYSDQYYIWMNSVPVLGLLSLLSLLLFFRSRRTSYLVCFLNELSLILLFTWIYFI